MKSYCLCVFYPDRLCWGEETLPVASASVAALVPLNPCQRFVGLPHKAQGKQDRLNGSFTTHKIQTSLYNAFAVWLKWNKEAVVFVSPSLSPLSLLFYKQQLHYQTICLVIMKAVGASLIWCGTAKLLNAPCWQGPIQMWQRAQSLLSHTYTHTHIHTHTHEGRWGTGRAKKKLQTPFLCI